MKIEEEIDVRKPSPLKDYNRFEKSISSASFISKNNISRSFNNSSETVGDNSNTNNQFATRNAGSMRVSSRTPKYRLQTLDEFFSDIPEQISSKKSKSKRTVIIEEDSSSEGGTSSEETTSEDEEYDNEEEETTSETSSDDDD